MRNCRRILLFFFVSVDMIKIELNHFALPLRIKTIFNGMFWGAASCIYASFD